MKPASSVWYATELAPSAPGWWRALHIALALLAVGLLTVLAATIAHVDEPQTSSQRFDRAQLCLEPPVASALKREALARLLAAPRSAAPGCWHTRSLPEAHPAHARTFATGAQDLGLARLRWHYVVPLDDTTPTRLTVFVPRVMGWAWQLSGDGVALADNLQDWRMTWNQPVVVTLPPRLRRAGETIEFELALAYVPSVGFEATPITVGKADALERHIAWRLFLQVSLPQACAVTLLLLGGLFFAFWLSRRGERAHLLLALAGLAWCVCDLQYVLPRADDPRVEAWYDTIVGLSIAWVMWLVYLIVLRFAPQRASWIGRALPLYVLVMTVAGLPLWGLATDWGLLFQAMNTTVAALVTLAIIWAAVRGNAEVRAIATALVVAVLAGGHDVALLDMTAPPEGVYLLPFASLAVYGSFLFALQRRYHRAIAESEQFTASLERQLAEREAELNANHARLRMLERDQTLTDERQRLMHDMHDGVGSALLTTLAAVEHESLPQADVATALRACVEDLRLVIDSLEPMGHDLVTLLATLRYRVGPRIEAAGLQFDWNVQTLPALNWLEAPEALQVLRIVQEALANVIKHSGATRLGIATRAEGGRVVVEIEDDGRGFVVAFAGSQGRGLRGMARRAKRLGGELEVWSEPEKGARLRLILPVTR